MKIMIAISAIALLMYPNKKKFLTRVSSGFLEILYFSQDPVDVDVYMCICMHVCPLR